MDCCSISNCNISQNKGYICCFPVIFAGLTNQNQQATALINFPVFVHKTMRVQNGSIWCALFCKSSRIQTGVGFMNVTDEVLMIMRLLMVVGAGKVVPSTLQRSICCPWIARGHPDLLPAPAISLHQQMAAGILSLKYPSAESFSYYKSYQIDTVSSWVTLTTSSRLNFCFHGNETK